jgi:hypothetical protein
MNKNPKKRLRLGKKTVILFSVNGSPKNEYLDTPTTTKTVGTQGTLQSTASTCVIGND